MSYLIPVKINIYLPNHDPSHDLFGDFPLYCKASKLNLENNDFIVHVRAGLISRASNITRALIQTKCVKFADFSLILPHLHLVYRTHTSSKIRQKCPSLSRRGSAGRRSPNQNPVVPPPRALC